MNVSDRIQLAMVGCGAVAEVFHLPAVARNRDCTLALFVDRNVERARQLAKTYRVADVDADYHGVKGRADAAIVALPHHLHETVCSELLATGVHVLVEKPMALSTAQCRTMISAAETGRSILAVGLYRRFCPSTIWVREAVRSNALGTLRSFTMHEGFSYNWPLHSDFFLRRETAGGGVLFDTGAHTLDQLLYWLGEVRSVDYHDDSYGGVEADCRLDVTTESGAVGVVELSRTRCLRNAAILQFERATVVAGLGQDFLRLSLAGADMTLTGLGIADQRMHRPTDGAAPKQQKDLFDDQLADFVAAIRGKHTPRVPGAEAARSIALIERCYAARKPLDLAWMRFASASRNGSASHGV